VAQRLHEFQSFAIRSGLGQALPSGCKHQLVAFQLAPFSADSIPGVGPMYGFHPPRIPEINARSMHRIEQGIHYVPRAIRGGKQLARLLPFQVHAQLTEEVRGLGYIEPSKHLGDGRSR